MTAIAPVITIDGPSGAGKGTLCKAMAEALQWHLLDSGAIYRVLALAALHHHVDVASEDALVPLASHLDVRFVSTKFVLRKWRMQLHKSRHSHAFVKHYCVANARFANYPA